MPKTFRPVRLLAPHNRLSSLGMANHKDGTVAWGPFPPQYVPHRGGTLPGVDVRAMLNRQKGSNGQHPNRTGPNVLGIDTKSI